MEEEQGRKADCRGDACVAPTKTVGVIQRLKYQVGPLPEGGPGDSAAVARSVFRYIAIALTSASGMLKAGILVSLVGLIVHRPLARVPENALKLAVGIMLSSFGTFWLGEGYGLSWPGSDFAILGLMAGFAATALLGLCMIRYLRRDGVAVLPS